MTRTKAKGSFGQASDDTDVGRCEDHPIAGLADEDTRELYSDAVAAARGRKRGNPRPPRLGVRYSAKKSRIVPIWQSDPSRLPKKPPKAA